MLSKRLKDPLRRHSIDMTCRHVPYNTTCHIIQSRMTKIKMFHNFDFLPAPNKLPPNQLPNSVNTSRCLVINDHALSKEPKNARYGLVSLFHPILDIFAEFGHAQSSGIPLSNRVTLRSSDANKGGGGISNMCVYLRGLYQIQAQRGQCRQPR